MFKYLDENSTYYEKREELGYLKQEDILTKSGENPSKYEKFEFK